MEETYNQIVFVKSNYGIEEKTKKKSSHPILVYQNHHYWFREKNVKSNSRRFCCRFKDEKKCSASITISNVDNLIIRQPGDHSHKEDRIALYNEAQANLTKQISDRAIAAHFP
ncbi:unnamed protein product [Brachionus calyciflorus]|uniref:FLYWCH-type domain-containing protein n=1 Tax=Brachionus calyciflorus TaxID=104777 RepID=A0A814PGN5_9BILA|nr:unnamed protein product [Brachionus calyciflorus]